MIKEIHLTKKDFKIEFYSGTGPGGQNRNKVQSCCRITHLETGLKAQSTKHRDRVSNQRDAFDTLAKLVLSHYYAKEDPERFKATEVIRNYHGCRNEVKDKASGFTQTYTYVVEKGNLGDMIEARLKSKGNDDE